MNKINFDNKKSEGFFARKGFYIALATCLIAVGAATWTAVNTFSSLGGDTTLDVPSDTSSQQDISSDFSRPSSMYSVVSGVDESSSYTSSSEEYESLPSESSEPDVSSEDTSSEIQAAQTDPAEPEPAVTYVLPVSGTITKKYSGTELQYSSTYNDWRIHQGIDIAADSGAEVAAIAGGTVTEVYSDPLWGTTIVIEHRNGVVSYYSGLDSETNVQVGDTVSTSQKIGKLGTIPCESADGIHLHLGIKQNDEWVSPLEIMGIGQ